MYQSPPQPHLSGGYYGPAIPVQPQQLQQPRTCFCCPLSTAIKSFVAFCIAFGIAVLILWLIFRPSKIQVAVDHASLTRFNLTTSPTTNLYYNLSAQISIRNPNKRIGIYYDWLEADTYYYGQRFGFVVLPPFFQDKKNTSMQNAAFEGVSYVGIGDSGVKDFNNAREKGFFYVDLWLYGRIRYKFGSAVTRRYGASVKCALGLALVKNGSSNTGFARTQCDVVDY